MFRKEPTEATAAASVTALVRAELAAEQARKTSLEQRGLAVITSSGVLVTLLLAIGAASEGAPLAVTGPARISLIGALPAFIGAAISGILANWTWTVNAVPVHERWGLRNLVEPETFDGPHSTVDRPIVEAQVGQIARLREVNGRKAWALQLGLILEVFAILCVALVIALTVL
jgi:hypothetical protein